MPNPQPRGNICIDNKNQLRDSIDYLMQKVHPELINKDVTVTFCNLIDDFSKLPVLYKFLSCIQTLCLNIVLSFCIYFLLSVNANSISIKGIIGVIITNFILCILINYIPKNKLQNIYAYLNLSAYGLKIERTSANNQSKVLRICTSPKKWFNKLNKFNKYIISLYNIIAAFKCVLSTENEEIIIFTYKLITGNDNIDSYLYFLVSYFLYDYKNELFEKHKDEFRKNLHKTLGSNWKKEENFNNNISAILYDITRDEKISDKINCFLE